MIKAKELTQAVINLSEKTSVDEALTKTVNFLKSRNSLYLLAGVKKELATMARSQQSEQNIVFESQFELNDQLKTEMTDALGSNSSQPTNEIKTSKVAAGAKAIYKERKIDASLETQLEKLRNIL